MYFEDIEIGRVYHFCNPGISPEPFAYFLVESLRRSEIYPEFDCMVSAVGKLAGYCGSPIKSRTALCDNIVKLANPQEEKEFLMRTVK